MLRTRVKRMVKGAPSLIFMNFLSDRQESQVCGDAARRAGGHARLKPEMPG